MVIVLAAACSGPGPSDDKTTAAVQDPLVAKVPTTETVCDDGKDDDGDGTVDCKDRDCGPSDVCQIERCKTVCAEICECDLIADTCSEKELAGVLAGCQDSCSKEETRSQLVMADGVPCFVIGSVFLQQVQDNGICLGEQQEADGA